MPDSAEPDMRQQLAKYAKELTSFASSPSTFRILHSTPSTAHPPPKTLYILDSSFNLATQNADKVPKPATFPQRLAMMQLFASDLLSSLPSPSPESQDLDIGIDIAVTKLPYFIDKSTTIASSGSYPEEAEQVHLTGFDTLIRILDPKYYDPDQKLRVLTPFFERNRLRVTYRTDDDWGAKGEQDEYLENLGRGVREGEGVRREWVSEGRIEMCEGRKEGEEVVSSTKVRDAVRRGDREALRKLVTTGVAEWILQEGLYLED
jgi:nicotinamide-nucleotide adenylyltransferase